MECFVYEVSVDVSFELCKEFELYMRERHIPDVVNAGGFLNASFERSTPGRYRIRYLSESRNLLDTYLRERAPALREAVKLRFPTGLEFSRDEWEVIHGERR